MTLHRKHAAKALRRIADLIEIHGGNVHRARAFANAARAVERLDADLEALISTGTILEINGIGQGTASVLAELASGVPPAALTELEQQTPQGLLELLGVSGLGPKKVRTLWQELGITSAGELAYACRENRLIELKGFGATSQARILDSLGFLMRSRERHLLHHAWAAAERLQADLHEALVQHQQAPRLVLTGELRRGAPTISCIELLVTAGPDQVEQVLTAVASTTAIDQLAWPGRGGDLEGAGAAPPGWARSDGPLGGLDIRTVSGRVDDIACAVHLVHPDHLAHALITSTGSASHVEAVDRRLREAGAIPAGADPGTDPGAGPDRAEAALYEAIGCRWVPPELREDPADLERAARGGLPELVRLEELQGALHNHTTDSDGSASVAEMAAVAARLGWRFLGIADHSPAAHYANGVDAGRLRDQWRRIDEINAADAEHGLPRVLKGLEADILPDGTVDVPAGCGSGLDYVVISIHSSFRQAADRQTERMLTAIHQTARLPGQAVLGHATGRLRLARPGYELDLDHVLAACAEHGVAVEINASPYRLDLGARAARRALELGAHLIINPDAHEPDGLNNLRWGVLVARRAGARASDVLNCQPDAGMTMG